MNWCILNRFITGIAMVGLGAISTHAWASGETSGGGDACEQRIKAIRDDIEDWISKGGTGQLVLPPGISNDTYSSKMTSAFRRAKVRCVAPGDEGYPVQVDGTAKTCRFDESKASSRITCDAEKFAKTNEVQQYVLVHHEFASLAGLEPPGGDDSNYDISNQLTGFLADFVVKKLTVVPRPTGKYFCPPTLDCRFSEFEFQDVAGHAFMNGSMVVQGSKHAFELEITGPGLAAGHVRVEYRDSSFCDYPMSVEFQQTGSGMKITSRAPTRFPLSSGRCGMIRQTLEVHQSLYFDKARLAILERLPNLALLDPQNIDPNHAVAGTYQLDARYMNRCNYDDTGTLAKLIINCDAPAGPIADVFRVHRSTEDLIREGYLPKDHYGWTACFNYPAEKVNEPLATISFPSISTCKEAIGALRRNYSEQPNNPGFAIGTVYRLGWDLVFSTKTSAVLTEKELASGNF